MILQGWTNELPQWIVEAIRDGRYTVTYSEKDKFDYLQGSALNPHTNIIIEFQ